MENFILIGAYLIIGKLLQKVRKFPENTGEVLNLYVIYIALPALVLAKVPSLVFSSELLVPAILPWLLLLATVAVILLLARAFNWDRGTTGALLICVPLGNTSFIGFPMIDAFYGAEGIPYGVLYDQVGSFLALAIYATIIAAVYSDQQQRPSAAQISKRIVIFPPFIALVAALVLRDWQYPGPMQTLVDTLASTLVPVIMVAVGFQLKFRLPREHRGPLAIGLILKLAFMPLLALMLVYPFGIEGLATQVSLLEAAMPSMISAGAIAIMAGLAPTLAAALIGYGIIFCFITLPLFHTLIQWL